MSNPALEFCSAAQESEEAARALLSPELLQGSVAAAAVAGDAEALAAHLAADPVRARVPDAALGVPPLFALSGSSFDVTECAGLLLDAGAEPNAPTIFRAAAHGRFAFLDLLVARGIDVHAVTGPRDQPLLHWCLDECFSTELLDWLLANGADARAPVGRIGETALHVAVRRRRGEAVLRLLEHGVDLDARTTGGMTAWRHALRRGFDDVEALLHERGADTTRTPSDELAEALIAESEDDARAILAAHPGLAASMGPEEARILPDLAGWGRIDGMRLLLDAGVAVDARGMDGCTGLQMSAWFAQPEAARVFLDYGADPNAVEDWHNSTPLGWTAHGSRYSGGAAGNQDKYVAIAEMLLEAGARLSGPRDPADVHGRWLLADATEAVAEVLRRHGARAE